MVATTGPERSGAGKRIERAIVSTRDRVKAKHLLLLRETPALTMRGPALEEVERRYPKDARTKSVDISKTAKVRISTDDPAHDVKNLASASTFSRMCAREYLYCALPACNLDAWAKSPKASKSSSMFR